MRHLFLLALAGILFIAPACHAAAAECEANVRQIALKSAAEGTMVYVAEQMESSDASVLRYQVSVVDSVADMESYELFDITVARRDCSVLNVHQIL